MAFIDTKSMGGDPHDFLTIKTLIAITGSDISIIHNKLRRTEKGSDETGLDYCHPYPNSDKEEDKMTGPKFVVLNDKCGRFIEECEKI